MKITLSLKKYYFAQINVHLLQVPNIWSSIHLDNSTFEEFVRLQFLELPWESGQVSCFRSLVHSSSAGGSYSSPDIIYCIMTSSSAFSSSVFSEHALNNKRDTKIASNTNFMN